jgi:hypothetical protein
MVAHVHGRDMLASLAWASSSVVVVCAGSSLGTSRRWPSFVMALAHLVASTFMCFSAWWQVAVSTLACASSAAVLLRRTTPRDAARVAVLMMLAGNVASGCLALVVGIDKAYESGIVSTSNDCVHLVVAGLALWAMQAR